MFQYAFGCYLAHKHACKHWLDISSYESHPTHGYLLDCFQIEAGVAGPELLNRLPRRYRPKLENTRRPSALTALFGLLAQRILRRHKESPFGFHPRHLDVRRGSYLVGYWQSERFFPGLRHELLSQFQLRKPLSDRSQQVQMQLRTSNSLAVHVRRGDYLTNTANVELYCQLGPEYYRWAIEDWVQRQIDSVHPPEVFVFSNDFAWCREHLSFPWKTNFVDHNTASTAHEDLILMSEAQCCVIGNSTFSWWAAWLNQRSERSVYAPREWFRPGTLNSANIVPPGWLVG